MDIFKTYKLMGVFFLVLIISSCASWQENYGKLQILPVSHNDVTIQDLINKWDDYHVYYSDRYDGYNVRSPLGIMFDPKNNDTTLVGDRWKKVRNQKDLMEMTKWIYPTTQYEPWLNKVLGPDGRFYGYIYYSYGFVTLKVVDDKTMYVFNLEHPHEEGDGEPQT
ncbi:MAG: hypothetical protein JRF17_00480 [Deltaproteobacteria bacterium]|jgi:hypothetical protein|nr:hypothetical protein [Deltaproteobacteria bacterium]MBW2491275.1 hypothetical protein [Deltaproteobacteria bacterium]